MKFGIFTHVMTAGILAACSFSFPQENTESALPFTAQDPQGKKFHYGILEDNVNFSDISIRPKITLDMDVGGDGLGVAYGIDAEYLQLPVYFRAAFHRTFFDQSSLGLVGTSDPDRDPMQGLEAGAAFPIIKRSKKTPIKVVLKSTLQSSTATSKTYNVTSLPVEGTHNRELLARGGFYYHRNASPDGNVSAVGGYAGLGWLSRHFLKIDTDKYGVSSAVQNIQFYADAIIAPAISHDDDDLDTSSFGVRGGLYFFNGMTFMMLPLDFKMEAGLRPGASGPWYFLFDLGFPFNLG